MRTGSWSRAWAVLCLAFLPATALAQARSFQTNDCHLHLTNYIQEGPSLREFLRLMGNTVGRVALFGIPLQQQWSHRVTGERAPTYYLESDAHLYYYSFTDAFIATAYRALPAPERERFDPMITGFNPADMYAAEHIRRVLQTFPGVFSGIGEFTIHKEFVSAQVAGDVGSLLDPALDRILSFAEEAGLLVILHNDVDVPFPKPGAEPAYLADLKALLKRHPGTTILWAHTGVGRVIRPIENHLGMLAQLLEDPELRHVSFDISWSVVAEYVVSSEATTQRTADLFNRFPDRFVFGTDALAPKTEQEYLKTYAIYAPLWARLTEQARTKIRKGNYERLFDEARRRVRAWEKAHPPAP